MSESTDQIKRTITIQADLSRVWRALANAEEFGDWFGIDFRGVEFSPGRTVTGKITYPGYEHLTCEIVIDRMEPERLFSFRWHPNAIDPEVDYSTEPMTLVVFELQDTSEGVLLTLVESGFDQIPVERRADAFLRNGEGWSAQMQNIERHAASS